MVSIPRRVKVLLYAGQNTGFAQIVAFQYPEGSKYFYIPTLYWEFVNILYQSFFEDATINIDTSETKEKNTKFSQMPLKYPIFSVTENSIFTKMEIFAEF